MLSDDQLLFPRPTVEEVLDNITSFFFTDALQREAYDELNERKAVINILKARIQDGCIESSDLIDVLQSSPQALNSIISLLGISQERFMGILTLKQFSAKPAGVEWKMGRIKSTLMKNPGFAHELAEMFIYGKNDTSLQGRVPPFDLDKFDVAKLLLDQDALVDSLLRLGLKGRYDAKKGGIVEDHIEEVIRRTGVSYQRGEIRLQYLSRSLDIVIPSIDNPIIMIESGIFETTARELSDKARVEALGLQEIESNYPSSRFVRITDGIGWIRRGGRDLRNLIDASHYFLVFKTLDKLEDIIRHYVSNR